MKKRVTAMIGVPALGAALSLAQPSLPADKEIRSGEAPADVGTLTDAEKTACLRPSVDGVQSRLEKLRAAMADPQSEFAIGESESAETDQCFVNHESAGSMGFRPV